MEWAPSRSRCFQIHIRERLKSALVQMTYNESGPLDHVRTNAHIPPFLFLIVFSVGSTVHKLSMAGFEPRFSGVGRYHSATTTALELKCLTKYEKLLIHGRL